MVLSGAWSVGLAERHRRATRGRGGRPARMLEAEASPGAPERPCSGSRVKRSRTPSREPSLAVAFLSGDLLAYSGGPAPESHRLPVQHPAGRLSSVMRQSKGGTPRMSRTCFGLLTLNRRVDGSSPSGGTSDRRRLRAARGVSARHFQGVLNHRERATAVFPE